MQDPRLLIFGALFGGQFNTLSQIFRILVAIFLAYTGTNNDLLSQSVRDLFKLLSLFFLLLTVVVGAINFNDFLH